jgi:hypothetical protein
MRSPVTIRSDPREGGHDTPLKVPQAIEHRADRAPLSVQRCGHTDLRAGDFLGDV